MTQRDRSDTPEIVLCGNPSPIGNTNPCPLEKDHEGEHLCWGEGLAHGNTYGITVLNHAGERRYHFTMEGRTRPEELCALLAVMDVMNDPERFVSAEERAEYRRCQESVIRARRDPLNEGRL